jgi:hypothetical protein
MRKKFFSIFAIFSLTVVLAAILLSGWLLGTRSGASFVVQRLLKDVVGAADYTMCSMEGSLAGHLVIKDLEISRFQGRLPRDLVVRISKIDVFFSTPLPRGLNVEIHNGRVILPGSGNIIFDGLLQDGVFEADLYGRDIYLGDIYRFSSAKELADLRGRVSRLESHLKISKRHFAAQGMIHVADIQGDRFVLEDCPLGFQWEYSKTSGPWGQVNIFGGQLGLPHTVISLAAGGRVELADGFRDVRLDVKGSSRIEGVDISIRLKGTLKKPELRLDSDLSLRQERLLVMLLTGKSWKSAQESLAKGEVSADMVKDVLDFIFFDGQADKLARLLGISEVHLEMEKGKRGFGLGSQLTPRVKLNYSMGQEKRDDGNISLTHTAGVVYEVVDHLSVEGQKEMRSQESLSNTTELPATNDAVYVKYKQQF